MLQNTSIIIAGDLVPTQTNYDLFAGGDVNALVGLELLKVLCENDYRIFNLEVPLTDTLRPIKKCGPNLSVPSKTINGICALNPTLVVLANNHILDQGEQGLNSTIHLLMKNNIYCIGAGNNLFSAAKPHILEKNGKKIGIYACAEFEFSIATPNAAGANPFDPLESLDHIARLRTECDYVIVLYHGGKEHYRYPSPYLQRVCRKMVDKGAGLIICQHSHCIGAKEEYEGATIVYGQGNFLFDYLENEYWKTSLLVKVNIDETITIEYVPICKYDNGVCLAKNMEKDKIIADFQLRSQQILEPGFIEKEYSTFCKTQGENYLRTFLGYNRLMRGVDKITKGQLTRHLCNEEYCITLQNYIECEAHREVILRFLKEKR